MASFRLDLETAQRRWLEVHLWRGRKGGRKGGKEMEAVKGGDDDDDKIQKISGLAAAGFKNASFPSMRDPNSSFGRDLQKGSITSFNRVVFALKTF